MVEFIGFIFSFIVFCILLYYIHPQFAKKTFLWLFVIFPICVAVYAYSITLFFSIIGGLFVFGFVAMIFDTYKKSKALRLS